MSENSNPIGKDNIDYLVAMASIVGEKCCLNHGNYECDDTAVDAIVIPMGYRIGEIEYEKTDDLLIYVCRECAETLYSQDKTWVLFYCLGCNSSAWKIRELCGISKDDDMIKLQHYCPHCYNNEKVLEELIENLKKYEL